MASSKKVNLSVNERKLSAKLLYEFKKEHRDKMPRFTITISRQYGCHAYPLAAALARIFKDETGEEFSVFHDDLNKSISDITGMSEQFIDGIGGSGQVLDMFSGFLPNYLSHAEAYTFIRKEIRRVAKAGNAIIIGKGGGIVCNDLVNCVHVRLEAPIEMRVRYVVKCMDVTEKEALKIITMNDKSREKFYENALGEKISDNKFYDLVLREGVPTEQMARIVYDYFLKKRDYVLEKTGLFEAA